MTRVIRLASYGSVLVGMHAFEMWRCMFGSLLVACLARVWVHAFTEWKLWRLFMYRPGSPTVCCFPAVCGTGPFWRLVRMRVVGVNVCLRAVSSFPTAGFFCFLRRRDDCTLLLRFVNCDRTVGCCVELFAWPFAFSNFVNQFTVGESYAVNCCSALIAWCTNVAIPGIANCVFK